MTLSQYLKDHGVSQAAFAQEMSVDPISVYRWCKGYRFPREHIQKIMEATGGKVTANDFFHAPDPSRNEEAAA